MSVYINVDELSQESRTKVHKDLEIKIVPKYGFATPKYVYPYEIVGDDLILPFSYGSRRMRISRPPRSSFPAMEVNCIIQPREEQKVVLKEALTFLNRKGSVVISTFTGFGKTACAIKLASQIGFRTLIIVNKLILMKQWEQSVLKFCPDAVVKRLTPRTPRQECDFYIMNAQNVEKMPKGYFSDVGAVIVDEAHLIMAETLSRSLQHVFPRYLIGLTATPYRPDGLDSLLEFYFGKFKIVRKLYREHKVYKVETGFRPKVEYAKNGKINWGVVLDSQANDENRNELIIRLLQHFSDRKFLVMVKRISQGEYLVERLKECGESVTSLVGKKQEFDSDSRILIGTTQKVGVGFDHPGLDALLLGADVEEYFIQYLGRVFRTRTGVPIILDLVDINPLLDKHFRTRRKCYQEHGGTVRTFDLRQLNSEEETKE